MATAPSTSASTDPDTNPPPVTPYPASGNGDMDSVTRLPFELFAGECRNVSDTATARITLRVLHEADSDEASLLEEPRPLSNHGTH